MVLFQSRREPEVHATSRAFARPLTPALLSEVEEGLRLRFLVLAPRRVEALRAALAMASGDDGARRDLGRLGHQLRGTAGTVGLGDLGLLGAVIERAAAASPYTAADHDRAVSAVGLVEEYVSRARCDITATSALARDPRFALLEPGLR